MTHTATDWIHWKGGPQAECPIPNCTPHQVLFLDGDIEEDYEPETWLWTECGSRTIVAYRLVDGGNVGRMD